MAKPNVHGLSADEKRYAWTIISFMATIGGNLTIMGSAANIIVAEKANRSDPTINFNFFRHYRVCCWVTVLCCIVGGLIITAVITLDNLIGSNW
jgi:Na+/H+ antiporter NhaD/arsenite permease-like protein